MHSAALEKGAAFRDASAAAALACSVGADACEMGSVVPRERKTPSIAAHLARTCTERKFHVGDADPRECAARPMRPRRFAWERGEQVSNAPVTSRAREPVLAWGCVDAWARMHVSGCAMDLQPTVRGATCRQWWTRRAGEPARVCAPGVSR
eukprot:358691-Chlamydomonas_euryale.AAC.1